MKKVLLFATAALLVSGVAFADKGKKCCKDKKEKCCKDKKECKEKEAKKA